MEVTTTGGSIVKKTPIFGDPAIVITIDTGGTCTHEVHLHVNDIHIYIYIFSSLGSSTTQLPLRTFKTIIRSTSKGQFIIYTYMCVCVCLT